MRSQALLFVLIAAVCTGCKPSDVPLPRPVSVAYVRIVNLAEKPYELKASGRASSGPVEPGGYCAFNYVNVKSGKLTLVDDQGKALPLPAMPAAGADATYVIRGTAITTLDGEARTPPKEALASVCFRTLDSSTSVSLVAPGDVKTEVGGKEATKIAPGKYKVHAGSAPDSDIEVLPHGAYTILVVGGKAAPMLLLNSANPRVASSGSASS